MKYLFNILLALVLAVGLVMPFAQPVQANTETLAPDGEGALTQGTYIGAGNWHDVLTNDGDTSRLSMWNGGAAYDWYHTWTFTASGISDAIINSVTAYAVVRDGTYDEESYLGCRIAGTNYGFDTKAVCGIPYSGISRTWYTNPSTSAAWTVAQIDAAEFGIRHKMYTFGWSCTQIYIVINYTPIVAPTVTTQAVSAITSTTATGNGNVVSDGYGAITERGTVYNTTVNPDTATGTKDTSAGTTGAFTTSIDTLTKGTLYHVRAYAINVIGTSYGADVEFTTIDNPAIITAAATSVTVTTARLQSYLASSGGEICTVRFGWGTLDAADNITAYQHYSSFSGTWDTGSSPFLDVDSLTNGTLYYFNVEASNISAGNGHSTRITFTTETGLNIPTNITAIPTGTSVVLSWTKGANTPQTKIRYAINSCPTDNMSGILLPITTESTYTHTGLTPGNDYCYWLSGYDIALGYSATAVTIHATTSSESTTTGFMENDTNLPVGFIADPTASALADKNPADYIARQNAAAIQMPIDFYYPVMAFFAIIILAFVAFRISKEPIAPSVVACLLLGAFGWPNIIPGWIALILILLIIGINILRMRQVV